MIVKEGENLFSSQKKDFSFHLPPSKSLMARRLVLQVLEGNDLSKYLEDQKKHFPEDIEYLLQAFTNLLEGEEEISVGESGTAMRLMTAFLAFKVKQKTKLYGLGRQHERPIAPLVDALASLGAKIEYLEKEGFPPLLFSPSEITPKRISLDASQSSQYLSALLLLAPLIKEGDFVIDTRRSGLVSAPYALMTVKVLEELGYRWRVDNGLFIYQGKEPIQQTEVGFEADWTGASYAYELCSMLEEGSLMTLPKLRLDSLQGDAQYLPKFFEQFGVKTFAIDDSTLQLKKNSISNSVEMLVLDCSECPDLVPTFVASCIIHKRPFSFNGVAHLRIKESDRLMILQRECLKIGVRLSISEHTISWNGEFDPLEQESKNLLVLNPEGDHRMAMALVPMMCRFSSNGVFVENPEVVRKSFPHFWDNLTIFGYSVNK